jgi:hypothetical protein
MQNPAGMSSCTIIVRRGYLLSSAMELNKGSVEKQIKVIYSQ